MAAESEVKSAGANIRASAISTIVLGFAADPMARWVWPDSSEYLRMMPQFVELLAAGHSSMAQPTSLKEFAPPPCGCRPASSPTKRQWAQSWRRPCVPEIAEDIGSVMKGMAEHHPHEPHWYLPLIAADPNWIGQGLGTLLMKHALRRCDEEGIAAYLESSNPRNISFYERHGFKIVGKIQSGSSPVLTPMLRPASRAL